MKKISLKELKDTIKLNQDCNFLAISTTPFHVLGADAAIKWLSSKELTKRGICLVKQHPVTGYACEEGQYINEISMKFCVDINGIFYNTIKDKFIYYFFLFRDVGTKKDKEPFYIIGTKPNTKIASIIYWLFPNRHIIFLIVDEGAGAYMNTDEDKMIVTGFKNKIKFFLNRIHCYYMGELFPKYFHDIINQKLFHDTEGKLVQNDIILPFYRDVFLSYKLNPFQNKEKSKIEKAVIICTTAWYRDRITDDEDLRVVKDFCSYLHSKKIPIFLKLHPRDNFFANYCEELHSTILDCGKMSIESFCAHIRPKALVSFSSTALVTTKMFTDIPVYSLSDRLNRAKVDSMYLKESDEFKRVFGNFVIYIHKNEDFIY